VAHITACCAAAPGQRSLNRYGGDELYVRDGVPLTRVSLSSEWHALVRLRDRAQVDAEP
jgi:hypothetical protein